MNIYLLKEKKVEINSVNFLCSDSIDSTNKPWQQNYLNLPNYKEIFHNIRQDYGPSSNTLLKSSIPFQTYKETELKTTIIQTNKTSFTIHSDVKGVRLTLLNVTYWCAVIYIYTYEVFGNECLRVRINLDAKNEVLQNG